MTCKYHNNLKATNTCSVCGEWICENCVLEVNDRIYCKDCLKEKFKKEKPLNGHSDYTSERYTGTRLYKSGFLTFILAFILPGTAQMYLGYMKRGLTLLAVCMLGFYIDAFSPLILLTYVFSLFDALKLKNNLERGIYQEDNISDIKKFLLENKFFIIILMFLIIIPMIINFFNKIFYQLSYIYSDTHKVINLDLLDFFQDTLTAILVICLSLFVIKCFKKNKKNIEKIEIKPTNTDNKNNK
ncbi:hypothetical protein [uncultured Tyzzerella sp.]|uniref:hypothetical protein n=1 Tax=uncultured Tyzzerella sp. TaxID=2321398 RepID=UPI0029433CD3|nr:hypothetical protein [uncultured Tyzzerella sp.]